MSSWAWQCCRAVHVFRSENFFKSSMGKWKVVERHGRCRVETLALSDLLVTSDKLSKTVVLLQRFVYIVFVKAGS